MADVQLEHGFTRIADALYEALIRTAMPGRHKDVVHAVIRLTYGYQKTKRRIGSATISKLVGINDRRVRRILADLEGWGVVARTGTGPATSIGIVKDFDRWRVGKSWKPGPPLPGPPPTRAPPYPGTRGPTNPGPPLPGDPGPPLPPSTENLETTLERTTSLSSEKKKRKPTQADYVRRAREVWPKLRDTANDTYGRAWGTHPNKRATELLVPLLRRGVPEADLVTAIHGCAALNRVREEPERLMYVRAQTVYQSTKFDGYVELGREAVEKRVRGSPRAQREAQKSAEWLAEHDRLRAEIERERKGDEDGG